MSLTNRHLIRYNSEVRAALQQLDTLAADAILIVVDENNRLIGSLTDGDLRRGFIKGLGFEDELLKFVQSDPKFIYENEHDLDLLEAFRKENFKIIPILNKDKVVIDILNFNIRSTILPVDAVIMAGGRGARLRPLTEKTPKPLLKVGDKPIIEYNVDRLSKVGIKNLFLSINYLGQQLEAYFKDGADRNLRIRYLREEKPLGTIGSLLLTQDYEYDELLIMNSDLLTNIDFVEFYRAFKDAGADMAVAATTYSLDVPYAVLETDDNQIVKSLKEKPRYTYFSNAGIYLLKKELLRMIPNDQLYDVTDLMEKVLEMKRTLITFPINGYWLDIGKPEDYRKAQEDIKHLKL
ncbi:CBS domain-containing protein [Arachidicoccus rhizosphaerae]|uniref:CBS domain-containing protein n=1 Tax=Arachidicoccus rhizosphaerae TaxID=551991 RepID=A0A1H4CP40_9BACT|nr:nucleotidyltransferase family protein [Arachidicoccus rhizosphaerae]SEA62196.1 CBS domain-containing protein [Arachidicoccus rhizosphaerae]